MVNLWLRIARIAIDTNLNFCAFWKNRSKLIKSLYIFLPVRQEQLQVSEEVPCQSLNHTAPSLRQSPFTLELEKYIASTTYVPQEKKAEILI